MVVTASPTDGGNPRPPISRRVAPPAASSNVASLPPSANSFMVMTPGSGIGGGGGWGKRGRRAKTRRRAFWAGSQTGARPEDSADPRAAEVGGDLGTRSSSGTSYDAPDDFAVRDGGARSSWETLVHAGRPGFDVGAGDGTTTDRLVARGARVICVEAHPTRASALRDRYGVARGAGPARLGGRRRGRCTGRRGRHGARQPHRPHPHLGAGRRDPAHDPRRDDSRVRDAPLLSHRRRRRSRVDPRRAHGGDRAGDPAPVLRVQGRAHREHAPRARAPDPARLPPVQLVPRAARRAGRAGLARRSRAARRDRARERGAGRGEPARRPLRSRQRSRALAARSGAGRRRLRSVRGDDSPAARQHPQ